MKYLIAGLGNIGPQYELTRHNIGFLAMDELARKTNSKWAIEKVAYIAETKYKGRTLFFIKPNTFMNLSGKAINYWLQELKIPVENLLVITDDIALPFGKLRMRPKGSNGGHNGLGNIQETLATDTYTRLRVGVGNDFSKGRQVDFVLSNFNGEELKELPFLLNRCEEAAYSFATIGVDKAMNIVNTNNPS